MPDLLAPFSYAVSAVLVGSHNLLTTLGLNSDSALTWTLSTVLLVCVVRALLLPLTIHGVKLAHASARARPAMTALREKYKDAKDIEEFKKMRAEQMAIQQEHGVSSTGCLPMLVQIPIFFALYQVLARVADGTPVGVMDQGLVDSMRSGRLFGVSLADRAGSISNLVENPGHFVVIIVLALLSAVMIYVTQRDLVMPNMSMEGMPEQMAEVYKIMPAMSAVGILIGAAAVPVGLLVYWVASNAWTLAQQAVITFRYPTPGSPAAAKREERLAGK